VPDDPFPRYRLPRWLAPPAGVVPALVDCSFVIARSDRAAIAVSRIAAFADSFEVDLIVLVADGRDELDPFGWMTPGETASSDALRFCIGFADGTCAANSTPDRHAFVMDRPTQPVLRERGGGGGGDRYDQHYWVWPLPPAGPMTFACEWSAAGITRTHHEIDAALVIEAAARAEVVFSDEHLPEMPPPPEDGGTAYIPR
jgi:hypothetical protein